MHTWSQHRYRCHTLSRSKSKMVEPRVLPHTCVPHSSQSPQCGPSRCTMTTTSLRCYAWLSETIARRCAVPDSHSAVCRNAACCSVSHCGYAAHLSLSSQTNSCAWEYFCEVASLPLTQHCRHSPTRSAATRIQAPTCLCLRILYLA